jgi:pimeloyl-ACP methyl ester carboxylesterase
MAETSRTTLFADALPISWYELGSGRPALLLHGGAGPGSMMGLAAGLAARGRRAIVPVYPGFDGEPRPHWFHRINDLAIMALALIERLDIGDATLIGNSVGGWLAIETGLRGNPRIAEQVIIDAVELDPTSEGGGIVDPASLTPASLLAHSFHDPSRALAPKDAAAATTMANNQRELRVYAGEPFMHDPSLRARLPNVTIPTLVLWGESDRIVTPMYGKQFATLIPRARMLSIEAAGHFPQIEQLDEVVAAIG